MCYLKHLGVVHSYVYIVVQTNEFDYVISESSDILKKSWAYRSIASNAFTNFLFHLPERVSINTQYKLIVSIKRVSTIHCT